MSVDERLRNGLEANALAFRPEGETRLADLHRRLRRRRVLLVTAGATAAAAAVALVVGLNSSWPSAREPDILEEPTTSSTATADPGPRIPASTWTKVLTRVEAEAAGVPEAKIVEQVGDDDEAPLTLQFNADRWSISVTNDQGTVELGDYGTLTYAGPDRVTTTSDSPGCPGCQAELTWAIDDDQLVLDLATGARLGRLERLITLGTWIRSG
jgi:hypothetical protein